MSLRDRIRARRERRRIEKGREVFQQNAMFDNAMSSLYGKDWRGNERINNDAMRKQFVANKDLFMQQARQRLKDNNKPSTDPGIQLPGTVQAQTMALDDMATRSAAPSPVMNNIRRGTADFAKNAATQRFMRENHGFRSQQNIDHWLNVANDLIPQYYHGPVGGMPKFSSIQDVINFQKKLGVKADGKMGNATIEAMRRFYDGNPNGGSKPRQFFVSVNAPEIDAKYGFNSLRQIKPGTNSSSLSDLPYEEGGGPTRLDEKPEPTGYPWQNLGENLYGSNPYIDFR